LYYMFTKIKSVAERNPRHRLSVIFTFVLLDSNFDSSATMLD
jgi:hypothetical protein